MDPVPSCLIGRIFPNSVEPRSRRWQSMAAGLKTCLAATDTKQRAAHGSAASSTQTSHRQTPDLWLCCPSNADGCMFGHVRDPICKEGDKRAESIDYIRLCLRNPAHIWSSIPSRTHNLRFLQAFIFKRAFMRAAIWFCA